MLGVTDPLQTPSQMKVLGLPRYFCSCLSVSYRFACAPPFLNFFSPYTKPPLPTHPTPPRSGLGGGVKPEPLSAPQPLNTYPALPFENKPWRPAPGPNLSLRIPVHMPHLRWERFGDPCPPFQEADVRVAARCDVSQGIVDAMKVRMMLLLSAPQSQRKNKLMLMDRNNRSENDGRGKR